MSKLNKTEKQSLVDELGSLSATMAPLKAREKEIKQLLIGTHESAIDGHLFRATISHVITNRVAWQAIANKVGYSRQLKTANTKQIESDRVSCKSLITD